MSDQDRVREEPMVIASADELLRPSTRRKFVRMLGVGGAIVMLPSVFTACGDDPVSNQSPPPPPQSPPPPPPPPLPSTTITFDLRTDVGIFRLVHTLEILEAYFYAQVLASANFGTFFSAAEQEVLTDIRNVEGLHREFFRTALGTQAVPDYTAAINQLTLTQALGSRTNIIATARMLEHTGVATLNGAGKYIKDARNLLIAGKLVSVEARHAAALRDILPPTGQNANVSFAGDDIVDTTGRDVKNEPEAALARLRASNILNATQNAAITIGNAPDATQGAASADLFPANP